MDLKSWYVASRDRVVNGIEKESGMDLAETVWLLGTSSVVNNGIGHLYVADGTVDGP